MIPVIAFLATVDLIISTFHTVALKIEDIRSSTSDTVRRIAAGAAANVTCFEFSAILPEQTPLV